ncbi:MAG: RNase adaptor protein RapZ [Beggiatoa sp. IS2]|nr:MAG: RNase adaptor protein RapZ [Beggiatoa sp. IS2]
MKLVIVSGLSGAGKTIALHSLEDMGAYCVDNLPVSLLPAFAEHSKKLEIAHECTAVGIDARTADAREIAELLQTLTHLSIPHEVLFLEASDGVLIKRFSETRRRHPLTSAQVPLAEAIQHERKLLEPLASLADVRVNTGQLHVHQLRDLIRLRIHLRPVQGLSLLFQSFGYKYGIPNDVDFVFDVRCLPNPHWQAELRPLTGRDRPVIHFLETQPQVQQMLEQLTHFLDVWVPQFAAENRNYLTIAIGCTGGQHRSVYFVEQLAWHFSQRREGVLVRHRELP